MFCTIFNFQTRSSGIFPELPKIPIKPVTTGRQVYRGVVIENVYFESMPGVFVAGKPLLSERTLYDYACNFESPMGIGIRTDLKERKLLMFQPDV